MAPPNLLALALDPALILSAQGLDPDPWQREFLLSSAPLVMLNCCRGAGKSRSTAALALHTALFQPRALVLLISRAQRQAQELYRYVRQAYGAIGRPMGLLKETETQLELTNGSRIVSLPGKEANIRSYQGVTLLVIDEAARVPDDLYGSVSPMTGISKGRQVLLSTPFGQRGFFWKEWHDSTAAYQRFRIPWTKCPRYAAAFIDEERRKFGDNWVEQEYACSFVSQEGLVYPDFDQCLVDSICWPALKGQWVGGIDWGWNNPFAAHWGVLDTDDVLWIGFERYLRHTPLSDHIRALSRPRSNLSAPGSAITWYADPSGPTEIQECRRAGLKVLRGNNNLRLGIAALTCRIRTDRLKVDRWNCPQVIRESQLYRYPSPQERALLGENPVDEHNHALGDIRYLVSRIDKTYIAKLRKDDRLKGADPHGPASIEELAISETAAAVHNARVRQERELLDNEDLWEPL